MAEISLVDRAEAQMRAALASAAGLFGVQLAAADSDLPVEGVPAYLNVAKSQRPAEILAEEIGLGEDLAMVEWVQTWNVEWICRDNDDAARNAAFSRGLTAIDEALMADRTLGGVARGLTIAPPDYVNHVFAGAPKTRAVLIPVRVVLKARSLIA